MKRYAFTGETRIVDGVILRRICAVTDFYVLKPYGEDAKFDAFEFELIKEGTLGGCLEYEENLSQDGFAWVTKDACIYGEARVSEGALIYGETKVFGGAKVKNCARVFGGAKVHGRAELYGNAMVYEDADVETGLLSENAEVHGNAHLYGEGEIKETLNKSSIAQR